MTTQSIKSYTELPEAWAGSAAQPLQVDAGAASQSSLIHVRKEKDKPKSQQDYLQPSN